MGSYFKDKDFKGAKNSQIETLICQIARDHWAIFCVTIEKYELVTTKSKGAVKINIDYLKKYLGNPSGGSHKKDKRSANITVAAGLGKTSEEVLDKAIL